MIQRIQSVYLFIVFIFALLYLVFPKGTIEIEGIIYEIRSWKIVSTDGSQNLDFQNILGIFTLIIPFLIMVLSIITTFKFKQRLLQIKLGKLNILLNVLLVVITFFYLDSLKNIYTGVFTYGAAVIFSLISMVLILLANRAIRKDENLVRAADRLR